MRALVLSCLLLLTSAFPGRASPVDAALQKELLAVYDAFNSVLAAGDYDRAVAQRPAAVQEIFKDQLRTEEDRKAFTQMMGLMTPDALEVAHGRLSADGNRATLFTNASKTVPEGLNDPSAPPPGTVVFSELTLTFVREGGVWKFENQTFGPDPATIVTCSDARFEPIEAYDDGSSLSAGGPIARVEFNADHTLIVIRVVDEENCVFLPNRETLANFGFNADLLQPYAIVSIEGLRHKTDKQKIWAESLDVLND